MKTGFTGWHILQVGMITGGHVLEEATLIVCLFNICCRCKQQLFLVSKCSLCVSLVTCLVSMISIPTLSHSGTSVFVL